MSLLDWYCVSLLSSYFEKFRQVPFTRYVVYMEPCFNTFFHVSVHCTKSVEIFFFFFQISTEHVLNVIRFHPGLTRTLLSNTYSWYLFCVENNGLGWLVLTSYQLSEHAVPSILEESRNSPFNTNVRPYKTEAQSVSGFHVHFVSCQRSFCGTGGLCMCSF